MLPGSPVDALLGDQGTPEQRDRLIALYGLDEPVWRQYLDWLGRLVHGDLGTSLQTNTPVTEEFFRRFPADIELCSAAMLVAVAVGVPVGYMAAAREGKLFDSVSMTGSLVGLAVPVFFLAFVLKFVFAVVLNWLPSDGRQDPLIPASHPTGFFVLDGIITGNPAAAWDAVLHLILPALAAAAIPIAIIARITRTAVRQSLTSDHVKFATATGIPLWTLTTKHILRPALIPIVTSVGLLTALLLTGAVLTETVFGIPGVGQYLYTAINTLDYPTIQGFTLLIGIIYMAINIIVDLSYGVIDPRVRAS
jgi:peptide/nickel transport system permease protein